jgi:hypothetical protein
MEREDDHSKIGREFLEKLQFFLLDKGFEQGYQLDKSLLTLSAGALLELYPRRNTVWFFCLSLGPALLLRLSR